MVSQPPTSVLCELVNPARVPVQPSWWTGGGGVSEPLLGTRVGSYLCLHTCGEEENPYWCQQVSQIRFLVLSVNRRVMPGFCNVRRTPPSW